MEKVSTVRDTLDLIGLVVIRFGGEVPGVSGWVDDTSTLALSARNDSKEPCQRLTVTPTSGLMSVHGRISEVRKGMCKFLEAAILPVFALIL